MVWTILHEISEDERNSRLTHTDDLLVGGMRRDPADGRQHGGLFAPAVCEYGEGLLGIRIWLRSKVFRVLGKFGLRLQAFQNTETRFRSLHRVCNDHVPL